MFHHDIIARLTSYAPYCMCIIHTSNKVHIHVYNFCVVVHPKVHVYYKVLI